MQHDDNATWYDTTTAKGGLQQRAFDRGYAQARKYAGQDIPVGVIETTAHAIAELMSPRDTDLATACAEAYVAGWNYGPARSEENPAMETITVNHPGNVDGADAPIYEGPVDKAHTVLLPGIYKTTVPGVGVQVSPIASIAVPWNDVDLNLA